jgi:3-hydroxyisobutyrate dehydrogenase
MGLGLAASLVRSGRPVIGYDVMADRRGAAQTEGIDVADDMKGLARCKTFLFALPDGPDVRAAVGELLETGVQDALLIDCSTVDPETTSDLARLATESGSAFADAGMGGDPAQAAAGQLLFMVGSDAASWPRVLETLKPISRGVVRCGDVGAGVATKIINNALALTIFIADTEAVALAKAAGLEIDVVLGVLEQTAAGNVALDALLRRRLLARDLTGGFRSELALKDLNLAHELASRCNMRLESMFASRECFAEAIAMGHGHENVAAAGLVIEDRNHVELSPMRERT